MEVPLQFCIFLLFFASVCEQIIHLLVFCFVDCTLSLLLFYSVTAVTCHTRKNPAILCLLLMCVFIKVGHKQNADCLEAPMYYCALGSACHKI